MITKHKPIIIAVDFDGTIVTHDYPRMGTPLPKCIETLKELVANGHKLMLWTMRHGDELQQAVDYLKENGVELWGINQNPEWGTGSNKQYAALYIDDAALGCPLVYPQGERPHVCWYNLRSLLLERGLITW